MSKFPAAFLSYFAPRDFYDNIGRNAPATRVSIELPAELIDWSSKSGDPPYTPQPVEPNLLAEIQNAVMRKYGGMARNSINAFRQDRGFGELGFIGRQSALDAGVGMRWMSQFGNEYVDIHVSPEAVRKLLGESAESLFMLVYYKKDGSYRYAAIPMGKIDNPKAEVDKKSTFNIDMSAYNYSLVQLKIANDTHVLATHLKFGSDGKVSVDTPSSYSTKLYYYNTKNTLLAGTKSLKTPDMNWFTPINWKNKTVYDTLGNEIKFESANKITANLPRSYATSTGAFAVSDDGGLYGAPYMNVGLQLNRGRGYVTFSAAQEAAYAALPLANTSIYSIRGGPGQSDINPQYAYYADHTLGDVSGSETETQLYYYNVYSNNGTTDKVELKATKAIASTTYANYPSGPAIYDNNISVFGLFSREQMFGVVGEVPTQTGVNDIFSSSGYALGDKLEDNFLIYNPTWDYVNYKSQTPYGVKNGDNGVETLFVANGKTSIAKIRYVSAGDYAFEIYKDRKEYGSKLTAALGITDTKDIQVIILDIKLSDIQKLK